MKINIYDRIKMHIGGVFLVLCCITAFAVAAGMLLVAIPEEKAWLASYAQKREALKNEENEQEREAQLKSLQRWADISETQISKSYISAVVCFVLGTFAAFGVRGYIKMLKQLKQQKQQKQQPMEDFKEEYKALYRQHKTLYQQIDDIIWDKWEIVEPKNMNKARMDVYRSYTPTILHLKIEGGSVEAIADKMYEFDVEEYGAYFANRELCRKFAEDIYLL
jgi:heme exporter protein D